MVALSALCFVPALLLQDQQAVSTSHSSSHFTTSTSPSFVVTRPFLPFPIERSRRRLVKTSLSAVGTTDILPTVREGIADAGGTEEWEKSVDVLSQAIDIETEEAEMLLAEALSWKGWAICSEKMRRFMRPVPPNAAKLEEALTWTKDGPLQMDQAQLVAAIKSSPKVYLVEPGGTYKKALAAAPTQYKDADTFKALVLEDPCAMECTYNCKEDGCASECGNCWVSYEMRS